MQAAVVVILDTEKTPVCLLPASLERVRVAMKHHDGKSSHAHIMLCCFANPPASKLRIMSRANFFSA